MFTALLAHSVAANAEPVKVYILGDSLTEGYGVAKEAAYPALIEKALRENGSTAKIVNSGISGSTASSAPSRLRWILKSKPDVVFIALGANDGLRGIDLKVTEKALRETIQLAKESNVRVWLADMKLPPNYGKDYVTKFNALFGQIARRENIPLSPFLLEGVAAKRELNQTDGIHPNEAGHKVMAEKLLPFFKEQLAKIPKQKL